MSVSTSARDHAGADQNDHIRTLLEQHRSARRDQLDDLAHADPDISDLDPSVQLRSLEAVRRCLGDIDEALARLHAGKFGLCTGCAEPIASERLIALPYVKLCVRCAAGA